MAILAHCMCQLLLSKYPQIAPAAPVKVSVKIGGRKSKCICGDQRAARQTQQKTDICVQKAHRFLESVINLEWVHTYTTDTPHTNK